MSNKNRSARRNRAKGQVAMAKGTLVSMLRDCEDVLSPRDLASVDNAITCLARVFKDWNPHYIKERYGKVKKAKG